MPDVLITEPQMDAGTLSDRQIITTAYESGWLITELSKDCFR